MKSWVIDKISTNLSKNRGLLKSWHIYCFTYVYKLNYKYFKYKGRCNDGNKSINKSASYRAR